MKDGVKEPSRLITTWTNLKLKKLWQAASESTLAFPERIEDIGQWVGTDRSGASALRARFGIA